MPELASEERIATLEAENARLLAVCQEVCRLLTDSEEHSYGEIYTSAVDGLKGDDSALKARLDAAREEGKQSMLCPRKAHQPYDALECPVCIAQERDSLRAQLAERDATIASLRNRLGDNLCYLQPGEKLDPMLPKDQHMESCSRFYDQEVAIRGVLEGCMTVAQLEEKLAEAERERDAATQRADDMLASMNAASDFLVKAIRELAAQVGRLRAVADDVVQGGGIADLEEARAALAETPVASLAAVRDQARREAEMPFRRALWGLHGHSGIYGDDGEMQCVECARYGVTDYKRDDAAKVIGAAIYALQEVVQRCKDEVRRAAQEEIAGPAAKAILNYLAAQKYQGEEVLHAIIACDFASRRHMEDAIARVICELAAQVAKEPQP